MKKKGSTFIEIVTGITVFLIGILPVTYLTLNSLRALKRSTEIEDRAKVVTTVINYIKSRGYDNLLAVPLGGAATTFTGSYHLSYDSVENAYVVMKDGSIPTTKDKSFEEAFYDTTFNTTTSPDALFFIESLGVDLEGAVIDVALSESDLFLTEPNGTNYDKVTDYTNPITTSPSSVIIGDNGIVPDKIIFGSVRVTYKTKSTTSEEIKQYEQNFVVTPLENFN